jgi:Arc/MetJ family transcription regulator
LFSAAFAVYNDAHEEVCILRTNIVLDDGLVEEAFEYADVKTKRELVDLALREFVANHKRRDIRELRDRQRRDMRELRGEILMDPEYDHKKLREGD